MAPLIACHSLKDLRCAGNRLLFGEIRLRLDAHALGLRRTQANLIGNSATKRLIHGGQCTGREEAHVLRTIIKPGLQCQH